MISNPSLILTFTAADLEAGHESVQTVTGDDLLTRSISIEHRLLDGLKPSSDKAQLSISKGAAVTEDIIRTEGDIHAVLMDGSATLFTGYVSTNFSWSVTDYGEETLSITLEDVGTRLLEKSFSTEGFHIFQCEAYKTVEAIAEKAGITISPDSQKPTTTVVRSVEGDESCKDLLAELLYEIGYVYAFDEYGEMYLHKVSVSSLSGIPTVDSSSLVSVGGTAVSLKKKIRQYRTARVTFQRLGEADDYLVYRDTTGQGDGHPYCYHEMKGGEHFDGTENYTPSADETRTPAYIEAVNAASESIIVGSRDIVAVTKLRTVFTAASGAINASCSLAGGKYIKVHAENTGRTPAYLTRLDAYGSILYVRDENAVIASGGSLTTDDGSTLKEDLLWIHDEESAKTHANLLTSYHRNAGSEYTFTSFMDLAPGSVVHLEDDVFTGLSVNVLIVSKVTTDESDVYQYGAVGVSVFNLDADVISETFVKGDTDMRGEDAVTYFLDSTADVIRSDAAVTVKPFRRAGSSKAENIVCTLRFEGAADYGTDDETWILISEEDTSSVVFTPTSYGAYRVTMIVSNEEVCRKTIPRVYDGEKGETVSITASREIVEYYADGFPVDESAITVTAHANGRVSIYIGDSDRAAAEGDGEAVITISPSDYLDEMSSLMIRAVSGKAEDTVTIMRNTLQGSLEISSSTLSFAYYADNVPHDEEETAAVTVKAMNYKAFPTLRLDGTLLETPDEHEYTVEISVSELLSKESIELRAYAHTRSEALTIIKKTDRGVLTIVSDRYSFGYYADNEPHNATEAATVSIDQEGYSGMPDLYVRGLKTDYAEGTYSLQSSMLQNASSIILEIRKGSDRASIEIRKELDTAAVRLFISRDYVSYYYDNARISGDIPLSVMYSGLYYPPKVRAGNTDIPLTDGKGTIPASLLDDAEATEIEVTAYSERVAYASDTAVVRKEMLQLSLFFTLSAAQFGYGSDGEIAPESITVTNTTSGLSDNSKPVLKLAGIPVTWSDEGTFVITPDMVEGRYLTVEIVYGDETRSAIITKTFDGKMLRLSADSQFFRLSPSGTPVDGQKITLRVHTQGIEDEVSWTDNKGLKIPAGTSEYILRTGGASEPEEPDEPDIPPVVKRPVRNLFRNVKYTTDFPSIMYGSLSFGTEENNALPMGEVMELPLSEVPYPQLYTEGTEELPGDAVFLMDSYVVYHLPNTAVDSMKGKKLYIRVDDSTPVENASHVVALVAVGNAVDESSAVFGFLAFRKKPGITSGIYVIPDNITSGTIQFYTYYGYVLAPGASAPETLGTVIRNPVFVDIEAERDVFESRGLTTDAEIEAYLDSLSFEDFDSTEEGETYTITNMRSPVIKSEDELTEEYLAKWAGYAATYRANYNNSEWVLDSYGSGFGGLTLDSYPDFTEFRKKLTGDAVTDEAIMLGAPKAAGLEPGQSRYSFESFNTGVDGGTERQQLFFDLSKGQNRIYVRLPFSSVGSNGLDSVFGAFQIGISWDKGETYHVTTLSGSMNSGVITLPAIPLTEDGIVDIRTLIFTHLISHDPGASFFPDIEDMAIVKVDEYACLSGFSDSEVKAILDESPFTDDTFEALSVFIPEEEETKAIPALLSSGSNTLLLDNLSPAIGDNSDFADGYSYGYWAWNNRTLAESDIMGSDTTTPFPYTHTTEMADESEYQEGFSEGYIPKDMTLEEFSYVMAAMNNMGCFLGGWLLVDAPDQVRNQESIGIVTRLFGSRDDREKRIYVRMKPKDAVNTPAGFSVALMYSIQNPDGTFWARYEWWPLTENADGSWSGIIDFSFDTDLEFVQGIVYLMPVPVNDFTQSETASYFIDEFVLVPLSEYEESIPHEDDGNLLSILNDGLVDGNTLKITIGTPDSEPSEDDEPALPGSLFDGTPFIFTITADGLSDTIMIGFVRDGADGASTGTYIGAFTSAPDLKADGTKITSGDFYLDVSDPSSPVPYRWRDGMWQAVTAEDPDWSYVASVTLIDVMRYSTSLVSVSAYYGYFQLLAANKAFIDSLGAETITIKDGGSIESESYQETDGLEGFHIGEDGITAASGTWKGAFANGLSFIPPTEAHITADMAEKDAYLALKKAGITEGTYFEGSQVRWVRKDDNTVFPNPPAFFAPYITPEKDPLFHFLSLGIEKKEFVRFVSTTGNTVFSIAESEIFGYMLDAFPVAADRWLLVLADVEEGKDWEDNTVYSLKRKGLYILTKNNLESLMSIMSLGTADENISKYLVKQTGLPSSWSEGELSYPMPMMDFIPYSDYVTGKTWLISQETTPALYSISLSDSTDTQFKADGTASVTLSDGTAAAGLYFSRGIIDVNGYLRTRTIGGTDYIEAAVVLFTTETTTAYAVIRSSDMKNWTAVAVADGEALAPVLEAKNLYPMDFMEDDGTLLMTLFMPGENTYSFAFGRYDIATATLAVLPHESAVLNLHKNDFPFLVGGYGTPVYRYPLIRIGERIYGTSSGLNLFSYDTETKTYSDLTGIFTTLDISTSEASSPDEFFATRNNPLLSVEVPASEAPDYRAVMMASPDLMLIVLSHVPGTERIFLVFLSSGKMAIPAEYDTATGKLTVYPYASPESQAISETMMTTPLFFGDTVLLGINGVLMFRHLSLSIPSFTAPNLKPSDIAELMIGKPTVTDTAAAEFMDNEQIIPYTAYPVNGDTFILGLAGETVMGFYTLNKAGFEHLVSSSPTDPTPYITPFDITYPYMTILFYDHAERKTHFWSMQSHTVFDMDSGAAISTTPFTITATDGTVLSGIIWSYGMYARAPVVKRDGKFQATVMTDDSSGTTFYHAESTDGTTWTATQMKETLEDIVSIYAGSVDIGDSWLCYRYTPDDSTTSITVSLCLVHKDGSEDTVLASESYPMTDDSGMLKAIIRPALIETGGRFYAELPSSVISWTEGEPSATAVYDSDYLFIDLIQSDNGLLVQEYIENAMRFRELSLNPSNGEISELKTTSGRMFDYICGRSVFSDGGKRVSTHILGDATADDMRVELMAVADGLAYSVTVAGIDNIGEWLSSVIYSGSLTRYLHIFSLYNELYTIVNGGYDAMNEAERAIGVPEAEIEESAFIISDSAVVDIREKDDAIEIRLLPFSYEIDDTIKPFSELTMQPSSLFSAFFGKCWYIGNPEIVEPFLMIHKDSEEQVGVTFHWNFPAQLTSTSPDALLRAPILRDGAMNSNADTAIPDSFIDALPED